jgi:hypothetical protein
MKIENTTTEIITQLLCQVMESKEGQTDSEIVDEFEKQLKQKHCKHLRTTSECVDHSVWGITNGKMSMELQLICTECGYVIEHVRYEGNVTDFKKMK